MGVWTATISGIAYQVKNDPSTSMLGAAETLEVRGILTITILDSAGSLTFTRGMPITVSDSVTGTFYNGFIGSDQPAKYGPASAAVEHVLTCFDRQYFFDKGANTTNYLNWYAGDIATDFVLNGQPGQEGATVAANIHRDTTAANFNTGILSGTAGYTPATPTTTTTTPIITTNDGDLELAKAGSDVTFTESTTADFSTGTLTNCIAANNTLTPNIESALKLTALCTVSAQPSPTTSNYIYIKFWAGSPMTIASNDTLHYDVWVASTCPMKCGGVVPLLSDYTVPGALYDQNHLLNDAGNDLTAYAVDQWYSRTLDLSALSGKTIIGMLAQSGGFTEGVYTWYIRNCYLGSQSGSPFFSTTQTTPQLNPPQFYQALNYLGASFTASVVSTFDPSNSYRISPSHSIDAVKLLKGSVISWIASNQVAVYVSYNGGGSWIPATNSAALPGMPVGSNIAGLSMQVKESFTSGSDPSIIPAMDYLSVALYSAPSATKSDIVTSFITQSNWNTGTYSATQADGSGNLELAPYTRDWNNNLTTGQTSFFPSGTSQAASGGVYTITAGVNSGTGVNGFGTSRLDFLGTMVDFTIDCDLKTNNVNCEVGITYRQIFWSAAKNNTFGYFVGFYGGNLIEIGYGSNNGSTDSFTQLAQATPTISANTTYHIKIVVNGSRHQVYFNNGTTPIFDIVDSTYSQAGSIGLRNYNSAANAGSGTATWDNLVLAQQPAGTWASSSTPVSSLVTCGGSVITWMEKNTANLAYAYAFVQSSIDGGSTYQQCVNGGVIPGLTSGVSLSGKSVLLQVLFGTQQYNTAPMVQGLVWRVLGQYPGSSGTRSTAPMGIDYVVRGNQSGFGTASDGQAWAKTGTGTDAVSSDTLTISSTTGDVFELLGSRMITDADETVRFELSTTTGLVLRYVDSTHYYKLSASATTLSIIKRNGSTTTTLGTATVSLAGSTWYYMRFRIVGSGPINFYGKVWASGTLEPGIIGGVLSTTNPQWTVTGLE